MMNLKYNKYLYYDATKILVIQPTYRWETRTGSEKLVVRKAVNFTVDDYLYKINIQ